MALDEPKENDETFEDNGVNYLIEKSLFEQAKPINVDFVESAMGSGFSINSGMSQNGSSCGESCSC
ncbi:MAG: Fe-S cluster assembly protein HesB [Deltaproteobacteria bacterium]|nr:Fe-S cluster assembly protein HesB [Deltaproteobacteria bacterium]